MDSILKGNYSSLAYYAASRYFWEVSIGNLFSKVLVWISSSLGELVFVPPSHRTATRTS